MNLLNTYKQGIILILLFISASNYSSAQDSYNIGNRSWDVCIKTDLSYGDTTCNYSWSYTFHSDGAITESVKGTDHSVTSKNSTWTQKGKNLIITTSVQSKEPVIRKFDLIWTGPNTFHTIEKNTAGVTTHTYYKATSL